MALIDKEKIGGAPIRAVAALVAYIPDDAGHEVITTEGSLWTSRNAEEVHSSFG